MTNELRDALNGKDNKERLEKLEKYSSKYAASIRNILQAQNEGKCVFLYNEYVQARNNRLQTTADAVLYLEYLKLEQ